MRDKPRFLSEASLSLPQVALQAVTKETKHLFSNAFTLIAHGVSVRRASIVSTDDLQSLIDASRENSLNWTSMSNMSA